MLSLLIPCFCFTLMWQAISKYWLIDVISNLQLIKYGCVVIFNVTMWGCYINSLKALSSLQATVTNFATNFLSSGLAGFLLFQERLPIQVIYEICASLCLWTAYDPLIVFLVQSFLPILWKSLVVD